jgi:hypothetical protein
LLDKKLAPFQSYEATVGNAGHTFPSEIAVDGVNYDVFQTGTVLLGDEPCQKVSMFEAQRFRKSIRHMAVAAWGYVVVNGKALYNSATSVNFELHRSEEDTLTNKILELAGIIMNKVGLVTTIGQYSAAETTSQKS